MEDLIINDKLMIPAAELRESFARSGGPGGQHVNKTATKVELRWRLTASSVLSRADRIWLCARLAHLLTADGDLIVIAQSERSQQRNREQARHHLAKLIRGALIRPRPRRATKPSRGVVRRRLADKKHRSQLKSQRRRHDTD